ncbi:MAG: hypothetical protein FD138_3842 [Planctomycetota bacterium]|nr:MAG: hypothetical protein FD138_3842 [Planctomycetota bacterium]
MFEFQNNERKVSRKDGDIATVVFFAFLRLCVFTMLAMFGLVTASFLAAEDDGDDVKPVVGARQFNITEQNFEQLVFGTLVNLNQVAIENGVRRVVVQSEPAASMARKRLESAIDSELRWVESGCRLSEAQKKKLRLAGRGDIATFLSRAEDLRAKVVGRSLDQQEYSELSMEMSLLRMTSQNGLLNETSLFRKTLRRTLDPQQRANYQQLLRQRQLEAADSALSAWDRVKLNNNVRVNVINGIKLSPKTRREVSELIVAQDRLPESSTSYMNYIVLLEADRIADQIRPLMDDEQWEAFQKLVAQAKRVEPSIRRYAQWPPTSADEDDETKD